ncbi:hypothetical protein BJY04DRAFT_109200 [Aspergillus karnatakaensis]|uniref:uncharacterized protein n=1 Tax=Aspergillus karnatakaensis TaxID=1810916 RepID=UPI003CCDE93E
MPKTLPSKRALKGIAKDPHYHNSSSSKRSSKSVSLGHLSSDRKRRASSSTVSSLSSVTSMEGLSDDGNDSEDADDEEDQPILLTPSYVNRHKAGTKSTKRVKTKNLSDEDSDAEISDGPDLDDSSDDVYAAVDYISDGDDEEQDVEIMEELLILESEDEHDFSSAANTAASSAHDWAGPNVFNDELLLSSAPFFDEHQLYSAMEAFGETDIASETAVETPVARRVHFEEHSDSSSDSDSYTEDEVPGDFLQQDSLDPQLRRMIESDNEVVRRPSRRQSDEIYADSDYGHSNIYHVESDAAASEGSLSGYETDDGETTDEDLPPPATITHPRSILRRDSSASLVAGVEEKAEPTPRRRRGPIMGTFVADPHKPVALVDCTGKHLVIIPAYASSRHDWLESAATSVCGTANNSPRATTMHLIDESDTDALVSPHLDLSPMLASSANLMMTALGNDIAPGGQVMGPPEAFYPSRDFAIDSSFEEDDEDDDPEAQLNVDDFIDFGDGSSDDELDKEFEEEALASPMTVATVGDRTNGTPTPNRGADPQQASSAERFLNHLDRGIVTAFRRNHNRYQALLRLPQHREFMPANSPSRPASVFRHARHADQRTPTRKRKASGYAGGEAVRRKLMNSQRRSQVPF